MSPLVRWLSGTLTHLFSKPCSAMEAANAPVYEEKAEDAATHIARPLGCEVPHNKEKMMKELRIVAGLEEG